MTLHLGRQSAASGPSMAGPIMLPTLGLFGIGLIVSGLVELVTDAENQIVLIGFGALMLLPAVAFWPQRHWPHRPNRRTVAPTIAVVVATLVLVTSLVYWLSDTAAAPDALLEAGAGFATLATSSIDVSSSTHGVLLLRSLTQWFGGLLIASLVLLVVPRFSPNEGARLELGAGGLSALIGLTPRRQARKLVQVYCVLTLVVIAAYAASGMRPWVALNQGLTTISTGGFVVTELGFDAESALTQWVAVVAMAVSGLGVLWVFVVAIGRSGLFRASTEVRVYLAMTLLVAVVLTAEQLDDGIEPGLRNAFFAATSAGSTTGFTTVDWNSFAPVGQMLLLLLLAFGAPAAAGRGVGARRVVALSKAILRELRRSIRRRVVEVIRVDQAPVDEAVLEHIAGFSTVHFLVISGAALCLAIFGADLLGSVSGAVSAFSSTGPALGSLGPTADLDRATRLTFVVTAALARTGILPVLALAREATVASASLIGRLVRR